MSTCGHNIPTNATFCPFCGAKNAPAPVNIAGLEAMIAATEVDLEDDVAPRPSIVPWMAAALAMVALSVGVLWTASNAGPTGVDEVIEVTQVQAPVVHEEPRLAPVVFESEKLTTSTTQTHGEVFYNGKSLFRFEGVKGSRYTKVDERAEAIKLRINHAFAGEGANEKPRFVARMVDGTYQVVWQRPDSVFLITDVTKDDVRAWENSHGKTSAAILSNLIADRLNMVLELENELPNS